MGQLPSSSTQNNSPIAPKDNFTFSLNSVILIQFVLSIFFLATSTSRIVRLHFIYPSILMFLCVISPFVVILKHDKMKIVLFELLKTFQMPNIYKMLLQKCASSVSPSLENNDNDQL